MEKLSRKPDQNPYMKWWPKDWLAADTGLRMCGLATRGFWVDVLSHMWFSNPRGILTAELNPLVNLIGGDPKTIRDAMDELALYRVCSWYHRGEVVDKRQPGHMMCCRRMYREWKVKEDRREAGARGGRERVRRLNESKYPPKYTPKQTPSTPPSQGQVPPQVPPEANTKYPEGGKPLYKKELPTRPSSIPQANTQPISRSISRSNTGLKQTGKQTATGNVANLFSVPQDFPYGLGVTDIQTKPEILDLGWSEVMGVFCSMESDPTEQDFGFWSRRCMALMQSCGDMGLAVCHDLIGKVWDSLHPELHKGEPEFTNAAAFCNQETGKLLKGAEDRSGGSCPE